MFAVEDRERVRSRLIARARSDPRLVAAAAIGASAGEGDRWSDLDLTFGVADAAPVEDVLTDWTGSSCPNSTRPCSSICPSARASTACFYCPVPCRSISRSRRRRSLVHLGRSSTCCSVRRWTLHQSHCHRRSISSGLPSIMSYVPASASSADVSGRPSIGFTGYATRRYPWPAVAVALRSVMDGASTACRPRYSRHSRAHSCGHLKPAELRRASGRGDRRTAA